MLSHAGMAELYNYNNQYEACNLKEQLTFSVIQAITPQRIYSELLPEAGRQNEMRFHSRVIHQRKESFPLASEASAFLTCELTADVWRVVCAGVSLLVSHGAITEDTSWEMYMLIDQGESR